MENGHYRGRGQQDDTRAKQIRRQGKNISSTKSKSTKKQQSINQSNIINNDNQKKKKKKNNNVIKTKGERRSEAAESTLACKE
jgi:hypothetical protein